MNALLARALIGLGAVLVLGAVNVSIYEKEQIKAHGETIYLELAPVGPRSLMQGDYMALRFALARDIDPALYPRNSVPLTLDVNRVATLDRAPPPDGGLRMRFRRRNGDVWLGTNAYFFEEGSANRFEGARYGEYRIDRDTGEAVLVGLRDERFRLL
jgi:uncharacterized membrane-anchored protein